MDGSERPEEVDPPQMITETYTWYGAEVDGYDLDAMD